MSSKIWLINFVLAAAVVLFGITAYGVWSKWEQKPPESGSLQKLLPLGEKKISARTAPPETEYEVVVSNNLLSPNRNEAGAEPPPPPTETKTEEAKATGNLLKVLERTHQEMNLYGVVIMDNERQALIDLIPAKLRPSPFQPSVEWARVGDTLGMFKVKEIGPTSVVLTAGGYEWPVSLFDKDKPKKRVPVKKETGPIVIGAGSKPGTGEASGGGKEKEPSPAPAIPTKAVSAPGTGEASRGGRGKEQLPVPMPPRINPATIWKGTETKPMPNRPGPDKR